MFEWKVKDIKATNAIFLAETGDNEGRPFKSRFLQAGLVKYDFGVCLLKKETIDKFVNTFINQPVIIGHKDDIKKGDIVGFVHNIWFSPEDGWFWCDGKLIEEEAIKKVEKGFNVSCQYRITEYSNNTEKKLHNGNPYDKEILDGVFEHLAIVENPRYEDAFIAVNAYIAENEDRWITIKPNGEENKGRHLLLKDGETPGEAIQRVYGNKDQQTLFDTSDYKKTKEDYKKEKEDKQKEYEEGVKKRQEETQKKEATHPFGDDVDHQHSDKGFFYSTKGVDTYSKNGKSAEVETFGDERDAYRVVLKENNKRKDIKVYSTKKGMEKAVKEFLNGGENKETAALKEKTNLEEKENTYKDILNKYNEASKKRWDRNITSEEYHKAWDDTEKYKKELTKARREYAESIMSNFEETDNNAYEEKQAERKARYSELSQKAAEESSRAHQQFRDKMSFIPAEQPIHGAKDARYREKAWDTLGRAVKLNDKANYYEQKADSVGKAGISADDANAISKLAKKYQSGVDSAEKRRIIDRVIDIYKRKNIDSSSKSEDYSQYGFNVERNTDINRLQLKFNGKPDENTRSILKSYGFRWSPREGAWQRQLTGNAEYSLKQITEKLKAKNEFIKEFKETLYEVISVGIVNKLGELIASNKKDKEKWITIKGNHILLKDGESIADAFKRTTGVSLEKSNKENYKDNKSTSKKIQKILDKVEESNNKNITPQEIINNAVKNNKEYTAEEITNKIEEAIKYNEKIAKNNWETYKYYSDGKGHYRKERVAIHKKILNDIFKNAKNAKPKNGEAPTFIMLGGRGGSGKSKFGEEGASQVYNANNFIVLDADKIKESLPEYKGYNAFEVHEESSDIMKKALKKARQNGLNVVLDGTMKSFNSSEKKLKEFEKDGYNVEMYYMHLPREKSTERAIGRFMKDGGRYVPLDILLDMKENEENFDKLKKYAKKWAFYNNDVERGEQPVLIDKSED